MRLNIIGLFLAVQPKKLQKSREYTTASGLKRNKRFATAVILEVNKFLTFNTTLSSHF